MAVSTHRWRPSATTKSGYSLRRTPRKVKASVKKDDRCIIEMKFEKSPYFNGSHVAVDQVFGEPGSEVQKSAVLMASKIASLGTVSRVSSVSTTHRGTKIVSLISGERHSSIVFDEDLGDVILKKLYASEYVEAKTLKNLTKVKDPLVRSFIISDDPSCIEESINILELVKLHLNNEEWLSFKLIILEKKFDIKNEILSTEEIKAAPKQFVIKTKIVENVVDMDEDDDENVDEADEYEDEDDVKDRDDDDYDQDKESTSTSTIFDEDEETRMIGKMASSKFRDSRIIIKNKNKPKQPDMDPIERCFLALMKMLQDNIFSATKGLNELNLQINHMMDEGDIELDEAAYPHDQHIKIIKL